MTKVEFYREAVENARAALRECHNLSSATERKEAYRDMMIERAQAHLDWVLTKLNEAEEEENEQSGI